MGNPTKPSASLNPKPSIHDAEAVSPGPTEIRPSCQFSRPRRCETRGYLGVLDLRLRVSGLGFRDLGFRV